MKWHLNNDTSIEITPDDLKGWVLLVYKALVDIFSWRLPKTRPNKIGIVFAITTENNREKILLENDLIKSLINNLQESHIPRIFSVHSLPEKHSKKIVDSQIAHKYLQKTNSSLIIYGAISQRKQGGKDHYVFSLQGSVMHRPIRDPKTQQNFAQEFTLFLPNKVKFPTDEELLGFEVASQWLSYTTKYIIGLALFLSLHFELAYKIYAKLNRDIRSSENIVFSLDEMRKRLPLRLTEAASAICQRLYFLYAETRDTVYLQQQKPYLEQLKKHIPGFHQIALLEAIHLFLFDRNIAQAKKVLKRVKEWPDSTWRYSYAFLCAYENNLVEARRNYDKGFSGAVSQNVVGDVELFISDILDQEPDKYGLYFARGYVNFKAKQDFQLARDDFQKYLSQAGNDADPEIKRLLETYIDTINRKLDK